MVVVGFVCVLLLSGVRNVVPDKNLALFKKANNTLFESIKTLTHSDILFLDGSFDRTAKGKTATVEYFCKALADILQTKSVDCRISNSIGGVDSGLAAAKIDYNDIPDDKIALKQTTVFDDYNFNDNSWVNKDCQYASGGFLRVMKLKTL